MTNKKEPAVIDDTRALINQFKKAEATEQDMKDKEAIEGLVAKECSESLHKRDFANEIFGRIQATKMMADFANVITTYQLKEYKENKLYQSLKGRVAYDREGNEVLNVGTWDGFCRALGISRQKADLDISMLESFGQEAFEQLNAMGVSYRALRKLKKLPEEEREAVINGEAINLGDKDQVIDLIDEMSAKHTKEKQALKAKNQDLKNQLDTDRQLLEDKNRKIDELDREINQKLTPEQEKQRALAKDTEQVKGLKSASVQCVSSISQLESLVSSVMERDSLPEHIQETLYSELRLVVVRVMQITTSYSIDPALVIDTPEWLAAYEAQKELIYGQY